MAKPINKANLLGVVELLNRLAGTRDYYVLDGAYGGFALHTDDGRDVLSVGHASKSEIYHLMHAFATGLMEKEFYGTMHQSPQYKKNSPRGSYRRK